MVSSHSLYANECERYKPLVEWGAIVDKVIELPAHGSWD